MAPAKIAERFGDAPAMIIGLVGGLEREGLIVGVGAGLLSTPIMNDRAAFHQAIYAENMSKWNYATQSALHTVQGLGHHIGESSFLAKTQAPALLNGLVSKFALVAGFQDAFVATSAICIIGLIPALGLLGLKHKPGGAPHSQGGGE